MDHAHRRFDPETSCRGFAPAAPTTRASPRRRTRAGWPSATGSSSSTWAQFRIDQELFRAIPADLMLRYGFVPFRRDGRALVIVVSDPTDLPMIDELAVLLGTPVRVTVGAPLGHPVDPQEERELAARARGRHRGLPAPGPQGRGRRARDLTVERLTSDNSPIIRLVDSTVFTAIQRRASDIHIETAGRRGASSSTASTACCSRRCGRSPSSSHSAIISRIKVMAELDIAEKRVPQDGRFKLRVPRQDDRLPRLDHAERARRGRGHPHPRQGVDQRAVHRAAGSTSSASRSWSCGASASTSASPTAWCSSPGRPARARRRRSTRALSEIKSVEDKIITIEDPVEYQLQRHHADPDQREEGPDVRARPALDPAPRPRQDHGRRDPRPGNGADRHPVGAHRPPGVHHRPRQQRRSTCSAAS